MGFESVKRAVENVRASAVVAEKLSTVAQVEALKLQASALVAECDAYLADTRSPVEKEISKLLNAVTAAGSDKNLKAAAVDAFVTELGKL